MRFHIEKGMHSSKGLHLGATFKDELKFKCTFDPSCVYNLKSSDNFDVNKLFGFSTSWYHHKQSARVGWRCIDEESIQILAYSYDNWERLEPQLLGTVKPREEFSCTIAKTTSFYRYGFVCGKKQKSMIISISKNNWKPKYLLFPYFGGNMPAPHDMSLDLSRV